MSNDLPTATDDAVQTAKVAAEAIADKKGESVSLIDLSGLLVVTDVFVIASGTSRRHVKSLADDVEAALREVDRKPIRREGTEFGEWVLLDYGDVVVHLFDRETREYYDLEHLWSNAPVIEFDYEPTQPAQPTGVSAD